MKRLSIGLCGVVFAILIALPGHASSLNDLMDNLNASARIDLEDFRVKLSRQFGVDSVEVSALLRNVDSPADAYLCLRAGRLTGKPTKTVLRAYSEHKNRGWGAIAKQLGIKPGSAEFHAMLKHDPPHGQKKSPSHRGKHSRKKK